jgi:hypothetical protein
MTQSELEKAVSRATGESRRTIRSFGFSLLDEQPALANDPLLVLDCPGCGLPLDAADSSFDDFNIECQRCDAVYPFAADELYVVDGSQAALAACA